MHNIEVCLGALVQLTAALQYARH